MTRVAVFIDYQNLYHGARQAFGGPRGDPPTMGHVRPLRLGLLLKQLGEHIDAERELCAVTVYRGQPGPRGHPSLRSAFDRQVKEWRAQRLVAVKTRPLRYQLIAGSSEGASRWRAEEKGIDVLLALDVAIGARDDKYDGVGVVASAETDLLPAIEVALEAGKRIETANWFSSSMSHRLTVAGRRTWHHRLNEKRFAYVRDDTDYLAQPSGRRGDGS